MPTLRAQRFRRAAAAVAVLVLVGRASAQDYTLFGSINGRATAHVLPDSEPGVIISANTELQATHRLIFDSSEAVLAHTVGILPGGGLSHTVLEGYLALYPSPSVSLYAGRQRLDWGAGYLFRPTDALHPRPYSLGVGEDQERGFLGVAATLTLGVNGTLTAAANADDAIAPTGGFATNSAAPKWYTTELWKLAIYGGNASFFLPPVDVAVSMVYRHEQAFRPGVSVSVSAGPALLYAEGAVELHNAHEYPDLEEPMSFKAPPLWDPFPVAVDTLEDLISRIERGLPLPEAGAAGGLASVAPRFLRRHYVATSISADVAGYVRTELAAILGTEDASGAARARATLFVLGGTDLWLEATGFYGGDGTEFGIYPTAATLPGQFTTAVGATLHF